MIKLYTDGRCYHGFTSWAFILLDGQNELKKGSGVMGWGTKHPVCEYESIYRGLTNCRKVKDEITVFNDCLQVINGLTEPKSLIDKEYSEKIAKLGLKVRYEWVRREHAMIRECDRMAKKTGNRNIKRESVHWDSISAK